MGDSDRMAEHERNKLLRRVDWRFLLPNPAPQRCRCFAGSELSRAVAAVTWLAPAGSHNCDLAVASNPSDETLRGAFASLAPGGACYTEWYLPWILGPRRVRRLLERAGFTDVRCYWAWPLPRLSSPALWLPLEAPEVIHAYLGTSTKTSSRAQRVERLLWELGRYANVLPVSAIARKPGPEAREETMLGGVDVANVVGQQAMATHVLLLTGGHRSRNKVVALVCDRVHPQLALKMTRTPESVPGLRREADILQALESGRPQPLPGVPGIRLVREMGDILVVGETPLGGDPLYDHLNQATYRDLALRVTDWLANLATATVSAPDIEWRTRLLDPVLTDFNARFGPVIPLDLQTRARAVLGRVRDLPLVCEQRDCSPWNVLISPSGECIVLDWESAELCGIPGADLVYFLTYLAFFIEGILDSGREETTYARMWDQATTVGRVTQECCHRYCVQVGLDREALPAIRLWTWMLHAQSEYQRMVEDQSAMDQDVLRRTLFVRLWHAEIHRNKTVDGGSR